MIQIISQLPLDKNGIYKQTKPRQLKFIDYRWKHAIAISNFPDTVLAAVQKTMAALARESRAENDLLQAGLTKAMPAEMVIIDF